MSPVFGAGGSAASVIVACCPIVTSQKDPPSATSKPNEAHRLTSGSFDPRHTANMDVIARAARVVDTLVIGIGVHPGKHAAILAEEKIEMLKAEIAPVAKKSGSRSRWSLSTI